MKDRQLRYALAVRDEQSFSRAAERLLISQPSISGQIRLLEDELGFPLFRRTGRGVEVTQPGRIFLRQAEQAMAGLLGLSDLARQLRRRPASGFSIGLSSGIAQFLVPLVMEALRPALPDVQLSVVTAMTPRIQRLVVQEVLDLGVTVEIGPRSGHPALWWEDITRVDMGLFSRPDHPLAGSGNSLGIADIVNEPLIINEPDAGYGALVQSLFADRGLRANLVAIADHVDTVKMMIRAGIGIAILPAVSAIDEVQHREFVRLPLQSGCAPSLAIVRQERNLGSQVESYISRVRSSLLDHVQEFSGRSLPPA